MKKVFLSLATIAFVAVGSLTMTSCGDDESAPGPGPGPGPTPLTENFIQVNNDQTGITNTIYAVHVNGSGQDAPIKEYTLTDGTVVAAFEFVSHDGAAATPIGGTNTWVTLLTKVDTTIPVGTDGRYSLPFTKEGNTLLGGFATTMNDTDYSYADDATFNLTDLNYGEDTGTMTYVLTGKDADDSSITLTTNLKGSIQGLYSLNASQSKGLERISPKGAQLTLRGDLK